MFQQALRPLKSRLNAPCAEKLFSSSRQCPACEASLPDPDDIVVTNLKPSESYKNTILAGLTPSDIIEIARRALGVWNYQTSMEAEFQRLMLKDAQERASIMERDINNIVREANTKVAHLDEKISQTQKELDHALRKNQDLSDANRQTSKEYTKLRAQYDKLLGKTMPASVSRGRGGTSNAGSTSALLGKQQQQMMFGGQGNEQQETMGGYMNTTTSVIQPTPNRSFQPVGAFPVGQRRTLPLNAGQPKLNLTTNYGSVNLENNTINGTHSNLQQYNRPNHISSRSSHSGSVSSSRNGGNSAMNMMNLPTTDNGQHQQQRYNGGAAGIQGMPVNMSRSSKNMPRSAQAVSSMNNQSMGTSTFRYPPAK